jgi:hypothetical protein
MNDVDKYRGFLDRSFDSAFRALELLWLPWVGCGYRDTPVRTIVLGESVYVSKSEDREKTEASVRREESLRDRHLTKGLADKFARGSSKRAFLAYFERTVLRKSKVPANERQRLWSDVAYLNLVLRPMKTSNHRPNERDYADGWPKFLQVAAVLEATRCIVYGLERPKLHALRSVTGLTVLEEQAFPAIGKGKNAVNPRRARISFEGREMELFFIRHPSSFYPWRQWSMWLHALGVDLTVPAGLQSVAPAVSEPVVDDAAVAPKKKMAPEGAV